jgi:hypothetical protein
MLLKWDAQLRSTLNYSSRARASAMLSFCTEYWPGASFITPAQQQDKRKRCYAARVWLPLLTALHARMVAGGSKLDVHIMLHLGQGP